MKTMDQDKFSRAGNKQAPAVARSFFRPRAKALGRFDLTSITVKRSSDLARALTTGLLVLYPVFASAAVIIAGLLLADAGA